MPGPHNPFRWAAFRQWSLNGQDWRPTPTVHSLGGTIELTYKLRGDVQGDVEEAVSEGDSEPLGHEMLREAWEARRDNPRTSVILAIAATEVGTKRCIANLAPQAKWLIENVPSPPLVTILREYVPLMPAKLKIDGRVVKLPKKTLKSIEKGVSLRNKIVHGRAAPVVKDELDELLSAVRDLLYLLDCFSGREWAIQFVQPQRITELTQEITD